jgi:hypothetical protein
MLDDDAISPKERLEQFRALVGTEQVLTHPLTGSHKARVGPFTETVDSSVISAEVEFTPTQDTLDVIPAGASSIPCERRRRGRFCSASAAKKASALGSRTTESQRCVHGCRRRGARAHDLIPRDVSTDVGSMTQRISDKMSTYDKALDYLRAIQTLRGARR